MLSNVYAIVKYTILCTGETKICKPTKHLPIQRGCRIFRIQAEDFTRGGYKFRGGVALRPPSELCQHIPCLL